MQQICIVNLVQEIFGNTEYKNEQSKWVFNKSIPANFSNPTICANNYKENKTTKLKTSINENSKGNLLFNTVLLTRCFPDQIVIDRRCKINMN